MTPAERFVARQIAEAEMLRHGLDVSADRGLTLPALEHLYAPLAKRIVEGLREMEREPDDDAQRKALAA